MSPEWVPRFLLLYTSTDEARAGIPAVFPAHSAYADRFRAEHPGALLMLGPVPDAASGEFGALGVFTDRDAAEQFAAADPFVTEGVVTSWQIRAWLLAPEQENEA